MTFPAVIHVLAPTPTAPLPPDPGRHPFELELVRPDGKAYALDDSGRSGIILMRGVRGLGMPELEHHADEYASIAGAYYRDTQVKPREVFLPIYLFSDGESIDWVRHDAAFWKAHRYRTQLRLRCTGPDGAVRWLDIRYAKGGEEEYEIDPSFFGWAKYGVYYVAHQPFWQGEPVSASWGAALPRYFFGGGTSGPTAGPPFGIARPSTAGRVVVTNPGDEPSWPVWTLRGPMPLVGGYAARVGVGGRTVDVPFALGEDDVLVIDTSPMEQSAILNGTVDKTRDLGSYDFAQVEPGQDVELSVLISGSGGTVRLEIPTLYHKAFGATEAAEDDEA